MLCYAMLCYAMLCYAMPCHAILYHTIMDYAIPYYTILYYNIRGGSWRLDTACAAACGTRSTDTIATQASFGRTILYTTTTTATATNTTTTTQRVLCTEVFVSILEHLQSQKLFPGRGGVKKLSSQSLCVCVCHVRLCCAALLNHVVLCCVVLLSCVLSHITSYRI